MKILTYDDKQEVINFLKDNKVGIIPTDTVYGLVALYCEKNLMKLNNIKKRDAHQQIAVLVNSLMMAHSVGIISSQVEELLIKYPKGKLSVIVSSRNLSKKTIALRITNDDWLQSIIKDTGPLYATSANLHHSPVIKKIRENELKVDFIVDGGKITTQASTIINTLTNPMTIIRN